MNELYELKEMLCKELKEYGKKGEMTAGSLDVVDKLSHAIKNIDKIIESYEEEEYSGYDGGSYRGSYARGRGANARRDSMGRYSSEGYSRANEEAIEQLRDLMKEVPEDMKHEIKRLVTKLESM